MSKRLASFSKILICSALLTLTLALSSNAQTSGETVGVQGGRFGVGFTSSWPSYGLSGTLQVNDRITAEGVVGFFGTVSQYSGRLWYRFNRNENYDIYGYGSVGLFHWGGFASESVVGFGGGAGIEAGLQRLLKDENFPPIFINAELGLAVVSFEHYSGFSTLGFGSGIHYRFGGK